MGTINLWQEVSGILAEEGLDWGRNIHSVICDVGRIATAAFKEAAERTDYVPGEWDTQVAKDLRIVVRTKVGDEHWYRCLHRLVHDVEAFRWFDEVPTTPGRTFIAHSLASSDYGLPPNLTIAQLNDPELILKHVSQQSPTTDQARMLRAKLEGRQVVGEPSLLTRICMQRAVAALDWVA